MTCSGSHGWIQSAIRAADGMKESAATEKLVFGRDEADWDQLAEVGEAFLIERARLGRLTSYTELNAVLVNRTGLRHFDFELQADRTAMGHLLGLIVARNRSITGLMISALVIYLCGNDAGSGFYKLAQDLGELPPGTLSALQKEKFWVNQVKALHALYRRSTATTGA